MNHLVLCSISHNIQDLETMYYICEYIEYTYIWMLFSYKKNKILLFAIWYNMDGFWRHYTKWNESDTEKQILFDIIYVWIPKKVELEETE